MCRLFISGHTLKLTDTAPVDLANIVARCFAFEARERPSMSAICAEMEAIMDERSSGGSTTSGSCSTTEHSQNNE